MNKPNITEGARSNWHLIVVCLALFATAGLIALGSLQHEALPKVAAFSETRTTTHAGASSRYADKWQKTTKESKVNDAISEYEFQLANHRDSEDSAANLYRLANLYYAKKQDYEKAALYYETLLREYPDYMGIQTVFPSLAACYERQSRLGSEIHTYRRMLKYFPEDTQQHQWAKSKLKV